jgi:hypothetical protein
MTIWAIKEYVRTDGVFCGDGTGICKKVVVLGAFYRLVREAELTTRGPGTSPDTYTVIMLTNYRGHRRLYVHRTAVMLRLHTGSFRVH